MKRTCVLLLSVLPFAASCLSVAWWDRVTPRIAGLPFNFAWLMASMIVTSLCLTAAYRFVSHDDADAP